MPRMLLAAFSLLATAACFPDFAAAENRAAFDVPQIVACRDVTDEDFAARFPEERLVEFQLPLSLYVPSESQLRIEHLELQVTFAHPAVRVYDFLPRTTLGTDIEGTIEVQECREQNRNLGPNATSGLEPFAKAATGSMGGGSKETHTRRYEQLPPLEPVVTSGTLQRESLVYFKFRATPQETLEGSRDLLLILRVPRDWQTDVALLDCRAQVTQPTEGWSKSSASRTLGGRFTIALHTQLDAAARVRAERYLEAERRLRQLAREQHDAVRRRAYPTMLHQPGQAEEWSEPEIPADWYARVVAGEADAAFIEHLPRELQFAVKDLQTQRRELVASRTASAENAVSLHISDDEE